MSYLKPKSCHGSAKDVWWYLEHGRGEGSAERHRAIAHDSNIPDQDAWWKQIDAENAAYEANLSEAQLESYRAKGKLRTYVHYIISPDPKDLEGLGQEEVLQKVRSIAVGFCEERFSNHSWEIVYHDDNEGHIPHAHIIAGAVDLSTGKKLTEMPRELDQSYELVDQLSRKEGFSALSDREDHAASEAEKLREERRARGEHVPHEAGVEGRQTAQGEVKDFAERHMRGRSWKAEIRDIADECAQDADSFEAYQALMRAHGMDCYLNRGRQIVYVWSDGKRKVGAAKLGMGYQTDFLALRFMDLRFTKAGWAAQRGSWTIVKSSGVRLRRVTFKDLASSEDIRIEAGAASLEELDLKLELQKDIARRLQATLDGLEGKNGAIAKAQALIKDADLVAGLSPSVEPYREGGRIVGAPLDADVLKDYEAARKRLDRAGRRAGLPKGAMGADEARRQLELLQKQRDEAVAKAEQEEEWERRLAWASSVQHAATSELAVGASRESARYGARLDHARQERSWAATGRNASRVPGGRGAAISRRGSRYGSMPDASEQLVLEQMEHAAAAMRERASRRREAMERPWWEFLEESELRPISADEMPVAADPRQARRQWAEAYGRQEEIRRQERVSAAAREHARDLELAALDDASRNGGAERDAEAAGHDQQEKSSRQEPSEHEDAGPKVPYGSEREDKR